MMTIWIKFGDSDSLQTVTIETDKIRGTEDALFCGLGDKYYQIIYLNRLNGGRVEIS